MDGDALRTGRRNALVALGLAAAVFVFTRVRGQCEWYVALHLQLHAWGVDDRIRLLDSSLLLVLVSALAARLAYGRGRTLHGLGLTGSLPRGLTFALLAGLPMLLHGFFARTDVRTDANTLRGVLLAPVVEELFFRAVLVGIAVRCARLPFWPTAIVAGLWFGSVHVPWDGSFHGGHLGVLAATTAGGVWYAWILQRHDWNLWTTIGLHAVMNAAWMVFAVASDAGGGLWANVGRGLTIALGTVLTLRRQPSTRRTDAPANG